MSIDRCTICSKAVDTDFDTDTLLEVHNESVCIDCCESKWNSMDWEYCESCEEFFDPYIFPHHTDKHY